MIINLSSINESNAHAAIVRAGHKEYCFIGHHRRDRNLLGSPLAEGPSNLLQYRAWLWSEIHRHASVARENPAIRIKLRKVALSYKVVHEDTQTRAGLIKRAAKWYKEKVLMPQIVCTVCLVYLTDHNKGDFHMCAECAWSGRSDYDDDWIEDISWFCGDCSCILTHWESQMYGQCEPCRDKEQRFASANFDESSVEWIQNQSRADPNWSLGPWPLG